MSTQPAVGSTPLGAKRGRRPLLRWRPGTRDGELSLERIFRDHRREIYRYGLAIVGNAADAEDALQATMSAAVGALPGERREIAVRPWLYRVAHNEAISIIRNRREQPLADEVPEPDGPSAATEHEQRERLRRLPRLPTRDRDP